MTSLNVLKINEFGNMEPDKWHCSMMWCPSQCYMHKEENGTHYILYLRWRWDDPWQGGIVRNAWDEESMHNPNAEWSADLFEKHGLYFRDEEHEQAKSKLIELWQEYITSIG